MSFRLLVHKLEPYLLYGVRNAIVESMQRAWADCISNGAPPQEPDFVASLVLNATKTLSQSWNPIFGTHGIKVGITGVYCHQTPIVKFDSGTCELGDLLWCHIHTDKINQRSIGNAILYQAKTTPDQPYRADA
ncbi:MAG: hypothetical protein HQL03_13500 [Nitrospirae bacterium]|nr:hypothetical protein [Nitrospirota bacterium]